MFVGHVTGQEEHVLLGSLEIDKIGYVLPWLGGKKRQPPSKRRVRWLWSWADGKVLEPERCDHIEISQIGKLLWIRALDVDLSLRWTFHRHHSMPLPIRQAAKTLFMLRQVDPAGVWGAMPNELMEIVLSFM